MNQLESDANLARLRNPTVRHLVVLLMETGLRGGDACVLAFNPIIDDSVGWPCLRFDNTKVGAEQLIPLSAKAADDDPRPTSPRARRAGRTGSPWLFPGIAENPDGTKPYAHGTLSHQLGSWQKAIDVRDEAGQPVRVHAHQFRHTVGTRLINAGVPQHVIQKLLGHASPRMTARYAQHPRPHRPRRLRALLRASGSTSPASTSTYDPDALTADAEWVKHNLARDPRQPPQRLLRTAAPAGLPAPQRLPHLPRLPDHPRVPRHPPPPGRRSTGGSSPAPTPTASSVSPTTSARSKTASTASSPLSKPSRTATSRDPRRQHPPPAPGRRRTTRRTPSPGRMPPSKSSTAPASPITFTAVARAAGVSRGWLYNQSDLRDTIIRLRSDRTTGDASDPSRSTGHRRHRSDNVSTPPETRSPACAPRTPSSASSSPDASANNEPIAERCVDDMSTTQSRRSPASSSCGWR